MKLALPLRNVGQFCVFLVAYYLAYRYGMTFSPVTASPFWFPDSILLCALLVTPKRHWWILIAATLPIRLWSSVAAGIPLWFLCATFAIDSAKGIVTAFALRRFIGDPTRLATLRDFLLFVAIAVVVVPACGALAGAAARNALGFDFWTTWRQWFMGNVLTHLVITPAILYWLFGIPTKLRVADPRRLIEGAVVACGLTITGYLAFSNVSMTASFAEPSFFAPVPFLFWAAIRFGMFGASGAIVLIAAIAVGAALEGRGPFAGQSPIDTAMQLQTFLLWRSAPLYLVAILISQRSSIEQSLRESEERFRSMADFAPALIWMSDVEHRCSYLNQRWVDFTGQPAATSYGDGWSANVHPEDLDGLLKIYRTAFDARLPLTIEFRLRRKDGEYRTFLNHAIPRTDSHGIFLGYIGSCIDITERKDADAEIHRQQMELTHAARVSTLGQLSFALAHELSQPLTAALLNARVAESLAQQETVDVAELGVILTDIRHDNERAREIIDRMRSLLRRRELKFESLELSQLLDQVVALVKSDMLARDVTLTFELSPELPPLIADRVHVQQVLINLIVNGADAMHALPAEQRRLDIKAAVTDDDFVELSVGDVGQGIPQERLRTVFDPFVTTKSGGMGLGLSICKTIIETHGGRIWATNNGLGGATFHFTLRAAPIETMNVTPELPDAVNG
jgi:PAS domain S-box-containing protein